MVRPRPNIKTGWAERHDGSAQSKSRDRPVWVKGRKGSNRTKSRVGLSRESRQVGLN